MTISQSVSVLPTSLTPDTRAVLLDIEGTTTPVSFVYEILFPFARARLSEYISTGDAAALFDEYQSETTSGVPEWQGAAQYAEWLMSVDRKSTALKELQGRIWERGYASGELKGIVYDDVPMVLEWWHKHGIEIAIFSSGSVLAQKLIFSHTQHGDLTKFISAYFDTKTGAKREAASFRKIAEEMKVPRENVTFFSDTEAEILASHKAGMNAVLVVRG